MRDSVPRLLLACVLGASLCLPQIAVCQQSPFPQPTNSETDLDAVPLAPEQAASTFTVPQGFHVELFASEPDVQNPIAMNWDTQGRLWIAENYTYSGKQDRFDLTLRDRVVVFTDQDRDGRPERRTVFVDSVQMLTSVAVGYGGVWLMCPPQLLYIPDNDEDLVPDGPAQVVLDGFTVAQENYHNFANGLRFGPDGWLYGRAGGSCPGRIGTPGADDSQRVALEGGIWRYHPRRGQVEILAHGTTNPWGHDWNDIGECFFTNTVNGHLWHLIPGAHYARPFTLDPNSRTYQTIDTHADHYHFDTGQGWQASRDGAANDMGGGHAHCGALIYLGDQWPRHYFNNLLTLNLHGRRANLDTLKRQGSGYSASHAEDPFISADPFFRGMDLSCGPDGCVYVIDWSDTGECHERTGVHRLSGRIFRIRYGEEDVPLHSIPTPTDAAEVSWQLADEWSARSARMIIANQLTQGWKPATASLVALQQLLADSEEPIAVRALLTLHALEFFRQEPRLLLELLSHRHEAVRGWAIRLLTEGWPIDDCYGPHAGTLKDHHLQLHANVFQAIVDLASRESSAAVRLVLASSLQRIPVSYRLTLAKELVGNKQNESDHNLPLLVWYGLIPTAEAFPQELAAFALDCQWPKTQRFAVRRLTEISSQTPLGLEAITAGLMTQSPAVIENCLSGIVDGFRGWRKAEPPQSWPRLVAQLTTSSDQLVQKHVNELNVLFGDGRTLQTLKTLALDEQAEPGLRVSAIEALAGQSDDDMREIFLAVLRDSRFNAAALPGLARFNDSQTAKDIISAYRNFRAPQRPRVIALLTSRVSFAKEMLVAVENKKIPVSDLTAYDLRQLKLLEDESIQSQMQKMWGNVRESSADKQQRIQYYKRILNGQPVASIEDLQQGRMLYQSHCAKCHKLFGDGESIGPDLTGTQRSNLDYLLENVVDPSAVVPRDFRLSIIVMDDGRLINGLIVSRSERGLEIQTQTEKIALDLKQIEAIRESELSPMPEELLDQLSDEQIQQLFSYLQSPQQIALPEQSAVPR